jgi:hypothetical protein
LNSNARVGAKPLNLADWKKCEKKEKEMGK